jgi:hypothetical protein
MKKRYDDQTIARSSIIKSFKNSSDEYEDDVDDDDEDDDEDYDDETENDAVSVLISQDSTALETCCFDQHLFETFINNEPATDKKEDATCMLLPTTPIKNSNFFMNCESTMLMLNHLRTPTPLKNAIARVKLADEEKERLKMKGLDINSIFEGSTDSISSPSSICHDSGFLSFCELNTTDSNSNNNNVISFNMSPPSNLTEQSTLDEMIKIAPISSTLKSSESTQLSAPSSKSSKKRSYVNDSENSYLAKTCNEIKKRKDYFGKSFSIKPHKNVDILLGRTSDQLDFTEKARLILNDNSNTSNITNSTNNNNNFYYQQYNTDFYNSKNSLLLPITTNNNFYYNNNQNNQQQHQHSQQYPFQYQTLNYY